MRNAALSRATAETDIALALELDGTGAFTGSSGIGFFDHMLTLLARHARFDLDLKVRGDLQVDGHHTVEDIGITLGKAFARALGDKRGVCRYGSMILPMDEALILCAADLSGRGGLYWDCPIPAEKVGDFDTELAEEFFTAFAREGGVTLHLKKLAGKNSHHIVEGCFKSFARALRQAIAVDAAFRDEIPSTKGVLS